MVDLEPVKVVLYRYIGYIILLGVTLILSNLLFKKLEKWIKRKKLWQVTLRCGLLYV